MVTAPRNRPFTLVLSLLLLSRTSPVGAQGTPPAQAPTVPPPVTPTEPPAVQTPPPTSPTTAPPVEQAPAVPPNGATPSVISSPPPPDISQVLFGTAFFAPSRQFIEQRRKLQEPLSFIGTSTFSSVPDRYELGTGDQVTIRYWSPRVAPTAVDATIGPAGDIFVPTTGFRIPAAGRTIGQVEPLLRDQLRRSLTGAEVSLEVRQMRVITVSVLGDAYAPGSYEFPATATLFNVIYATGGPGDAGSSRRVQLLRAGSVIRTFDLYQFLLGSKSSLDLPLRAGDKIYFSPIGSLVTLKGEVFRQGRFEMLPNETLKKALAFAGGIKPSGVAQRIRIDHTTPGVARMLLEVNVLDSKPSPVLQNGDQIEVSSIRPELTNAVEVNGNVDLPGLFTVTKNMTVADVLVKARGVRSNTYHIADLVRRNPDGTRALIRIDLDAKDGGPSDPKRIALKPDDRLVVYDLQSVQWMGTRQVEVKGSVRKPGPIERPEGMTVSDALRAVGGLDADAFLDYAFLQRRNADGSAGEFLRIDLKKLASGDAATNLVLRDRDVLEVLPRQLGTYTSDRAVTISGAVQRPGQYLRGDGQRLRDLIELGGNLLPTAFRQRAFLTRTNPDGTAGPLVIVDLDKVMAGDLASNVVLQDGDRFDVYTTKEATFQGNQVVEVVGAVQFPKTFPRRPGMRVRDVLLLAGGLLPTAFDHAYLQRTNPDGTLGPLVTIDLSQAMQGTESANLLVQDLDKLSVYTKADAQVTVPAVVKISGAVARPGEYPRAKNLRLSDLVSLAGGTLPNASDDIEVASAYVPAGTPVRHFSLKQIQSKSEAIDAVLADGDSVTIAAQKDFVMSTSTVTLTGFVKRPGPYTISGRDTLSDLIKRAGGFSEGAFPEGTQFARNPALMETPAQVKVSPAVSALMDQINKEEYARATARAEAEKLRFVSEVLNTGSSVTLTQGEPSVSTSGTSAGASQVKPSDRTTVSSARPLGPEDLRPAGNIGINVPRALAKPHTSADPILQEGDVIHIPSQPVSVSVTGAVMVPSAVFFEPGNPLSYYVRNSGWYSPDAAVDRTLIIRATGTVVKAEGRSKIYPGDIIFVPTRVMAQKLSDNQASIDRIVKNVTNAALAYSVIRLFGR